MRTEADRPDPRSVIFRGELRTGGGTTEDDQVLTRKRRCGHRVQPGRDRVTLVRQPIRNELVIGNQRQIRDDEENVHGAAVIGLPQEALREIAPTAKVIVTAVTDETKAAPML